MEMCGNPSAVVKIKKIVSYDLELPAWSFILKRELICVGGREVLHGCKVAVIL